MTFDLELYRALCAVLLGTLGVVAVLGVQRLLASRADRLDILTPLLFAFAVRVVATVCLSLLGSTGERIRETDDPAFLHEAYLVGELPLSSARWIESVAGDLHVIPWALAVKLLGDPGDIALRMIQITFAVVGIAFIAAAVGGAGGPRAARLFCWIAALEPSNVLFTSNIQKESLILLAEGALVLGLARAWQGRGWRGALVLAAAGIAITVGCRPYLGAALALAAVAVALNILLRQRLGTARSVATTVVAVLVGLTIAIAVAPSVAPGQLAELQAQHEFVHPDATTRLEPLDVTTSLGLAETLAVRSIDLVIRPFPWQLDNMNQRLGAGVTVLWWLLLATMVVGLVRAGPSRTHATPLLYVAAFQLAAFALTLISAGLGFRHRVHIVAIVLAAIAMVVSARRSGPSSAHSLRPSG